MEPLFLEPPWSRFTPRRVHSTMPSPTRKAVMQSTVCVQNPLTRLRVSCLGYRAVTFTDVTLQLAEAYNLNAKLNDDTQMLSEAVVVSTANSKFAVEKTGAATNINNAQITALPLSAEASLT